MTKRERIYAKFGGLCAYTGKPLGDDWQIDHVTSKRWYMYSNEADKEENLFPALRIVNHYKRSKDLESFRAYMLNFHSRLGKLPKRTQKEATQRRIEYIHRVADAFGITVDKPFTGTFYFERL